jgi:hypothetical protein
MYILKLVTAPREAHNFHAIQAYCSGAYLLVLQFTALFWTWTFENVNNEEIFAGPFIMRIHHRSKLTFIIVQS